MNPQFCDVCLCLMFWWILLLMKNKVVQQPHFRGTAPGSGTSDPTSEAIWGQKLLNFKIHRFLTHSWAWALAKSFWGLTKLQFLTIIRIGLAVFIHNLINFLWKSFCSHVISVFSFLLDLRSRIIKTTRLSQFLLRSTFSTQNLF